MLAKYEYPAATENYLHLGYVLMEIPATKIRVLDLISLPPPASTLSVLEQS